MEANNMKETSKAIVAWQVPPEEQDSGFENEIFDGIEIVGNRYFQDYTSGMFAHLMEGITHAAFLADDEENSTEEILEDAGLSKVDGSRWTTEELDKWRTNLMKDRFDREECICTYLSLMTGHEWDHTTLRGVCQGDWQGCYYDTSTWTQASLDDLASRYFNTGTEWQIVDGEEEYYLYSTLYGEDNIRAEIADSAGVEPEDVEMHIFAGYKRIPQYQIA